MTNMKVRTITQSSGNDKLSSTIAFHPSQLSSVVSDGWIDVSREDSFDAYYNRIDFDFEWVVTYVSWRHRWRIAGATNSTKENTENPLRSRIP